jgi:hypothetical protein
VFAVAFLGVAEARAGDTATFSSFTVAVAGQITGHAEKVNCKGPVRLSVMVQRDATMPHPSAIVTVDTTGLACQGASSKRAYGNTGHHILTRIFSATDNLEAPVAFFPQDETGHLNARSAQVKLHLSYDVKQAALIRATGTLSSL